MGKKLTNEEFIKRVQKHYDDRFTFLQKYINSKTKLKCRCNKCGVVFMAEPMSFMQGKGGCRNCYGRKKRTTKSFQKQVDQVHGKGKFKVLGIYQGNHKKVAIECLTCGYGKDGSWEVDPGNLLAGHGCPKCYGNTPNSVDEVKRKIAVYGNGHYKLEKMYKPKTDERMLIKHLDCGHTYSVTFYHFLAGYRCPYCASSKGEKLVEKVLEQAFQLKKDHDFISQETFEGLRDKKKLRFDFYLPQYKLAIEYDGKQHYQPVDFAGKGKQWARNHYESGKHRDHLKDQYCKEHQIALVRIPYKYNTPPEVEKVLSQYIHE